MRTGLQRCRFRCSAIGVCRLFRLCTLQCSLSIVQSNSVEGLSCRRLLRFSCSGQWLVATSERLLVAKLTSGYCMFMCVSS